MHGYLFQALPIWAALDLHTLPQQVVNGLLVGSIYALIALGYTMVYGVLRLINFAHGEVYMLGAYTALFVSWGLGFGPNAPAHPSSILNLVLMLLASMLVCSLIGIIIERFAYRPMRNQARIASLITAIGISLFLQYGGQIVLPTSPPPNIAQSVNPFPGSVTLTLIGKDSGLVKKAEALKPAADQAEDAYQQQLKTEADAFNLSPKGLELRTKEQDTRNAYQDALGKANNSALAILVPSGQLIMLCVTAGLMVILTYLVMFTKQGRAMRAVSHDFDSASLMGVNVNNIVTFTFVLGSALAGAAAMMNATFLTGIKIDTFFGALPGVKAFVAAVLGGIGNIPGAVLGGLLMGVAEALVVWIGFPEWRDAVAFLVLIVILLVRPGGLLGSAKVEKV